MTKRPTDDDEPPAKKRGSGRQLTKDDASDDEPEEKGTIETATEEVMKARRVVKARRAGTGAPPPTPVSGAAPAAANPFSGFNLTGGLGGSGGGNGFAALAASQPAQEEAAKEATTAAAPADKGGREEATPAAQSDAKPEGEAKAEPAGEKETSAAAPAFASFASSTAPFAATAGSQPLFSFGSVASGASGEGEGNGAAKPFSFSNAAAASPGTFSFKPPEGGFPSVQSIFGSSGGADKQNGEEEGGQGIKPALAKLPPETETLTGEEDEETVWSGEGTLYEFNAARQWRERGKGELKINRGPGRPARFVMRQRGYLRLLMNASLWADMKVSRMDGGKGATFPVMNAVPGPEDDAAAEPKLKTFAFRLKTAGQLEAFIQAVDTHKAAADAPAKAEGEKS